jgi:prephenate dehydratase
MFFIEIEGCEWDANVQHALARANAVAQRIDSLGSYPVIPRYRS